MVIRLQLLLWVCLAWIGTVVAQTGSVGDILPRAVIKYDSRTNTAVYEAHSEIVDLTSGKGVYRVGFYEAQKKDLSPATFTQLVRILPL